MKKILIADTIFPKGHRYLNTRLINALSTNYDLTVVDCNGYYKELIPFTEKIRFLNIKFRCLNKNVFLNHILLIYNGLKLIFNLKIKKYDTVIFFTFDTLNFFLIYPFFRNKRIILIHHDNTAGLKSNYKNLFFNMYAKKVEHIVFCPILRDYIALHTKVDPINIHTLSHPLPENSYTISNSSFKEKRIIISTGYANDEELIARIIETEKRTNLLKKNNIFWKIRSNKISYISDSICVFSEHLPRQEYRALYNDSALVVLLYSSDYAYRFSGALFDGITNNRIVIGPDIAIVRYFSEKYPLLCRTYDTIDTLFSIIISLKIPPIEELQQLHSQIMDEYSQEAIILQFQNILK